MSAVSRQNAVGHNIILSPQDDGCDDDEEEEDEDEEEVGDTDDVIEAGGCYHMLQRNKHRDSHCKHVNDTQSCHTYEDQATQTEDEDDQDPDLQDVALLPYGKAKH